MVNKFGSSVNKIVLPEYGKDAVIGSIRSIENIQEDDYIAKRNTALDFYYNRNIVELDKIPGLFDE